MAATIQFYEMGLGPATVAVDGLKAEQLHRRAVVALECLSVGVEASSYRDIETWQVLPHRAFHGDESELAEVEEVLKPDPAPVEAPEVPAQRRGANRKRRRRVPPKNVVDFPRL